MAAGGTGGLGQNTESRLVLRCVDWLLAHNEPIEEQWWNELHKQATSARSPRDRRHAIEALASRVDPVPKAIVQANLTGPVTISWMSESPTRPALSNSSSTTPSLGNGHAPASSSATDALESL
jgi:hypothetical protein